VLFTLPMLNGADFVTTFLFASLGLTLKGYLLFLAAVVGVFALALALLKRKQQFNGRVFLPVVLESTIYALTMGSLIVLLMTKVLGFPPNLAVGLPEQGLLARLVMSWARACTKKPCSDWACSAAASRPSRNCWA
jgi:hypothetical protein